TLFFFSSRRRHTRFSRDWSSDVCSSDLILIGLVYLGGIGLVAVNNRRDLWLKIGIYWVIIVIVLWAASAAVNAPNTNIALAYVAKAVEFVLLGILLRIRTARSYGIKSGIGN